MENASGVQQIRERVLQIARQIEELSTSGAPPQVFFEQFLKMLVTALGAPAGAVWMIAGGGGIRLMCDVGLADTGIGSEPQANRLNQRLLTDVLTTGQASSYGPEDPNTELPSQHVIILAALQTGSDCVGVVEILQRPESPVDARPGYLQFVEQMCGYASRYLDQRQKEQGADGKETFWPKFEQFVLQLQRSLHVAEVSGTAANDGRLLLDCDRMSIAVVRGKKTTVKAISGQDAVNPRANLVRSMTQLASRIIALGEPITFSGDVSNIPRQIEKPLADYIQESGSRMVMVIPLPEIEPLPTRDEKPEDKKRSSRKREVIGCLVIEQVADSQPRTGMNDQVELIADHVAAALSNARTHQRLFLLSFWHFLGRCLEWFHGRKLAKTMAALSAVAVVAAVLAFFPWEYKVGGEGRLMPVRQREVFAPWDGEVVEIYGPGEVLGGQLVEESQELLKLHNDDLESQLVAAGNNLREKVQMAASLHAEFFATTGSVDREEQTRLEGRLEATNIEIEGLNKQIKILEARKGRLTIEAPIEGVVATFQVEQLLKNRPVQRGDVLLEVMDGSGPWQLELEIEEHRMGHILRAQEQLGTEKLPIEFILLTAPESTFSGTLESIATRSATSAEEGTVVEVVVSIDADSDENNQLKAKGHLRIGAEVRAKILCGQRSLGYVLFGDVIEFVQKYFWL